MDLKLLNNSEGGKFFYNVLVGIVTTLIIEFGNSFTNDILIPMCIPENKEVVIKLKKKKNKMFVGRFLVSLFRLGVISLILLIILNRFNNITPIKV